MKIDQLEEHSKENVKKIKELEMTIKRQKVQEDDLREKLKSGEGVNMYLRERDQQLEQIIGAKENTI